MLNDAAAQSIINAIKGLQDAIHTTAIEKGWWKDRLELIAGAKDKAFASVTVEASMLALAHSELSEGLEGLRKNLPDDHLKAFTMIECELADTIIRCLDHAAGFNHRVAEAVVAKVLYNAGREYKHGGKAL